MTNIYGTNGAIIPDTEELLDEMFSQAYRVSYCMDCKAPTDWNQSYEDQPDAEWAENRCWVCHMEEQDASDEYRRTKYDQPILVSAANEIKLNTVYWTSW